MLEYSRVDVKTEPVKEPVELAETKKALRIDSTAFDDLIGNLIKAARQAVEIKTRRTLISTTLYCFYHRFPSYSQDFGVAEVNRNINYAALAIPRPPVASISKLEYYNTAGVLTEFPAASYLLNSDSVAPSVCPAYGVLWPATYAIPNAVRITYVAGYGLSGQGYVPEPIRQAIISLVADLFEHPEANTELALNENRSIKFLLAAYTIPAL